jgi:polyphosphate glucokinase
MAAEPVWEERMNVFGIDVGGSGIKGAPVDTASGELLAERVRIKTPRPATPEAIVETAVEVVNEAGWQGPVGCGFPAVVKGGVVNTAANVDKAAIGFDLGAALERELDTRVSVVNDADAAGLAEMRWGAGRDRDGVVLMLTLGTGIGTSLFIDGRLVPNTELGHIEVRGKDGPHRRRRGHQQEIGEVLPPPHHAHEGGAGGDAEQRRHRGRRPGRTPGASGRQDGGVTPSNRVR